MSLLSDTVLSGSARLHIGRGGNAGKDGVKTSQSPGGLLTPLIQLVKDPYGAIIGGGKNEPEQTEVPDVDEDRKQLLYVRMRNADTYEEWKTAAAELDTLEGHDAWKLEDESSEYDAALVKARLKELEEARLNCDVKRMLFLIRTSLTRGLGGIGDLRLYKHSHVGTKRLIERYIESAVQTLTALHEISALQGDRCPVSQNLILDSVLATRQSYGRTALLLSGGGTFGMNHIGVVRSLWQKRLLPRIVSGASAGSIVCAVLCSKTDEEIPLVLHDMCYGDMAVFEPEGAPEGIVTKATRFLKYGSLFDISHLTRVMRQLIGDVTFQESYNRTRRILNITVSSASLYELPKLLNYVTAPDVMIWSAVCASCSVPFVFSTATILCKDRKTGKEVPWNPTTNAGWIDGSVDNDLPMARLAELFNVNHFIVSQVNPHVVPFLSKDEDTISTDATGVSAGSNWMHNMASMAKGEALHRLDMLAELGVLPNAVTKARSVLNQKYSGDITIFPTISYHNFPKILSNPTPAYMLRCLLTGEQATWPKLSRIQNHVAIELALDETVHKMRARITFSPSAIDLRLNNFSRLVSSSSAFKAKLATRSRHARKESPPPVPTIRMSSPTISRRSPRISPRAKFSPKFSQKPYLPMHPSRKAARSLDITQPGTSYLDVISSSTNPEGSSTDGDLSANDESETTELLSSPSPPVSPPNQMPTLWPSTRQIISFSSVSNPNTPSIPATTPGHKSPPSLAMSTTPTAAPNSPELRYKRLFHPAPPANPAPNSPEQVDDELRKEVEDTLQPLANMSLQHTESLPESQRMPVSFLHPEGVPELRVGLYDESLHSAANVGKKMSMQDAEKGRRDSRRGSAQGMGLGLTLDISGTRGMMLRKKESMGFGNN